MRRLSIALIAAASTMALTQIASAADLPRKAPVYTPPPAPVYNWTGFYAGVNVGFGGNNFKYPFDATDGVTTVSGEAEVHSSGFLGGGQIGYNWQFAPTWVAGLEADFQGAGIDGTASLNLAAIPGGALSASAGSKLNWFGTVRGRIGYLVTPAALLYATGGFAYGHVETSLNLAATGGTAVAFSQSADRSGWTAGAGIEYLLSPAWSLKTEYLYMDLGSGNVFNGTPTLFPGVLLNVDEKTTVHTVKVGLNYKFGAWH